MIPTACDNGLEIEESVSGPLFPTGLAARRPQWDPKGGVAARAFLETRLFCLRPKQPYATMIA